MAVRCSLRSRVEGIASCGFGNGHSEIDIESNAGYPYAWVVLVRRGQIGGVVGMAMTVAVTMGVRVRVTKAPRLRRDPLVCHDVGGRGRRRGGRG